MKKLLFGEMEFEAEKIVKTDQSIIGYDLNDNEVFTLKGISDFTLFALAEGQEWDVRVTLEQENVLLKAQNKALAERADFIEDLIAEIAVKLYP